jgi:uncharacterized coiled-coil protein SlyX
MPISTGQKITKTPRAGLPELFGALRRLCNKHSLTPNFIATETGYKGAGKILSGDRITVSVESEYLLRTFIKDQTERFDKQMELYPAAPPMTEEGVPIVESIGGKLTLINEATHWQHCDGNACKYNDKECPVVLASERHLSRKPGATTVYDDWKGEALARRLECAKAIEKMGTQRDTIESLCHVNNQLERKVDKHAASLTMLYGELATVTERLAKSYRVIEERLHEPVTP